MFKNFKIVHIFLAYLLCTSVTFAAGTLDWSVEGYPSGSFDETYTNIGTPPVTVRVVTTGDRDDLNDNGFSTPELFNGILDFYPNFEDRDESVTITITFSQPVRQLSFDLVDVDAGNFTDQVTVTGTGPSGAVLPTITAGTSNTVNAAGNVVTGNSGGADAISPVQFNDPVTEVVLVYGNGPGNPANPGAQYVDIGDLSWLNEPAPTLTKSFSPEPITTGGTSTMTLTLINPNAIPLTSAAVSDTYPAQIINATPANESTTCGGTVTATNGGTSVALTGGTIPANDSCTVTVDVTSSTLGTHTNTTGIVTTTEASDSATATDDLTVNAAVAPTVSKAFSPDSIGINGTSTLTITLGNTNTIAATLSAALVDTLPTAGNGDVVVATTPNIGGTCTTADIAAVAGATSITYANNATIPTGGCTITVDVTSSTAGTYTNTIAVGTLLTDLGNNAVAASDSLTVNNSTPPTVAKSFNPSTITAGGTSQLTITLNNTSASTINLIANMDDNLPAGITATSVNTGATTCTDAAVDISTNARVRYNNGATIPSGSCNIVVNVTSNTLGTVTNTIAAGALQTDAGNNASSASDNLTVNAGGGAVSCPAGTNLVNLAIPRNATTATSTGNVTGTISNGTGPILAIGTNVAGSNEPRLQQGGGGAILTLGFPDVVPLNGTIIISSARDNNSGALNIQDSNDGVTYSAAFPFSGTNPNDDIIEHLNYSVASTDGAQFVRFTRTAGRFRVDGLEYSQICEPIPVADLSITKDDSSLTYAPGSTATYIIVVSNAGPDAAIGASVVDILPNGVTVNGNWTCTPENPPNTASCVSGSAAGTTATGTGNINQLVDIPAGTFVTFSVPVQFSSDMNDY